MVKKRSVRYNAARKAKFKRRRLEATGIMKHVRRRKQRSRLRKQRRG